MRNYDAEKRKTKMELEETSHHPLKGIAVTVSLPLKGCYCEFAPSDKKITIYCVLFYIFLWQYIHSTNNSVVYCGKLYNNNNYLKLTIINNSLN